MNTEYTREREWENLIIILQLPWRCIFIVIIDYYFIGDDVYVAIDDVCYDKRFSSVLNKRRIRLKWKKKRYTRKIKWTDSVDLVSVYFLLNISFTSFFCLATRTVAGRLDINNVNLTRQLLTALYGYIVRYIIIDVFCFCVVFCPLRTDIATSVNKSTWIGRQLIRENLLGALSFKIIYVMKNTQ